jgi:uncharacterized protein YcnI
MTNNTNPNTSTAARVRRVAMATAALGALTVLTAAPAWAHVHVEADRTQPGVDATLTFEVPNESDKGAATTELTVALPNLTSVSTQQMPGWTVRLDRDVAAGTVKSITWTAAPSAGIAPDQFALFRVAVLLPKTDSVSFPATQTYSDGTVVKWDEPTPPGGAEPEHPSPTLALTGKPATADDGATMAAEPAPSNAGTASAPDDTARWLAGAGIAIGVVAVALTVWRRGSTSRIGRE